MKILDVECTEKLRDMPDFSVVYICDRFLNKCELKIYQAIFIFLIPGETLFCQILAAYCCQ